MTSLTIDRNAITLSDLHASGCTARTIKEHLRGLCGCVGNEFDENPGLGKNLLDDLDREQTDRALQFGDEVALTPGDLHTLEDLHAAGCTARTMKEHLRGQCGCKVSDLEAGFDEFEEDEPSDGQVHLGLDEDLPLEPRYLTAEANRMHCRQTTGRDLEQLRCHDIGRHNAGICPCHIQTRFRQS